QLRTRSLASRCYNYSVMSSILARLLGDSTARELQRMQPLLQTANALEAEISALSDQALAGKTAEFKERLGAGETLDDRLPEGSYRPRPGVVCGRQCARVQRAVRSRLRRSAIARG